MGNDTVKIFIICVLLCSASSLFFCVVKADLFDSASYEVSTVIVKPDRVIYDRASYQISVVIVSTSGSSYWSDYWEFYALDYDRCDYDTNDVVNELDVADCFINIGTSNYLYDCYPFPTGNDEVNVLDVATTFIRMGVI